MLADLVPLRVPTRPIIPRASSLLLDKNVLRIVKLLIIRPQNPIDNPWLQINKTRSGDIVVVVGLYHESKCLPSRKRRLFGLRPVGRTPAASLCYRSRVLRTAASRTRIRLELGNAGLLWFPHWPTWSVIISRGMLTFYILCTSKFKFYNPGGSSEVILKFILKIPSFDIIYKQYAHLSFGSSFAASLS